MKNLLKGMLIGFIIGGILLAAAAFLFFRHPTEEPEPEVPAAEVSKAVQEEAPESGISLPEEPETPEETSLNVSITLGDRAIAATMEDNAAARDFLTRLPLEVTLNDFNNTTEKIFYPSPALTTEGVARGCAPTPGDITIYAPWGNVAIFCKNWSYSNDLIKIGRIDGDGIEALHVAGDITVKFERR